MHGADGRTEDHKVSVLDGLLGRCGHHVANSKADLVILCAPVGAMQEIAAAMAPGLKPGAIISD
ncbi:MAG: prephenate dehydrogenase/arogenate dehydrogenase family protein, partial [Pseudomonadota bacterium]